MILRLAPEVLAIQPDAALWDAETGVVLARLGELYQRRGEGTASAQSDSRE